MSSPPLRDHAGSVPVQSFDRHLGPIETLDEGYGPIVDMTFAGGRLHLLETFGLDTPWTPGTGRVVRRNFDGSRSVIACNLDFPIDRARKGNDLFVSTVSYGQGPMAGLGKIVRIRLRGE